MNNEVINEIEEEIVELPELEEDVTLAGSQPTQITGQESGRVVGFGCDD